MLALLPAALAPKEGKMYRFLATLDTTVVAVVFVSGHETVPTVDDRAAFCMVAVPVTIIDDVL